MRRLILGDGIMLFDIKKNKKFPFLHISKESLFGILFEFIIIGILGFILETVLEYITAKSFVDRGFLCGPFIPIYGFFIVVICLMNRFPERNLKNYLFSFALVFVLSYIFEEVIGTSCEAIFKTKLWQYSSFLPFNSNTRYTNLIVSILWGIFGALYYMYAIPFIFHLSKKISVRIKRCISIEFLTIFSIDILYTLVRISLNGGYKKIWADYPKSTELTLFIIGIFAYFIAVILLMEFVSKAIYKLNKKLDWVLFLVSTFVILFPIFSAYEYMERSGIKILEVFSTIGFLDAAFLIYFLLAFIGTFILLSIYKLVIYVIEKKRTISDKFKFYKKNKFMSYFTLGNIGLSILILLIGILSLKNPVKTNISVGSGEKHLKIVAVSDIHYGTTGGIVDLSDLVKNLNKEDADVIFFLGDTIDKYASKSSSKGKDYLDYYVFASYMKEIKSTYGIYDISGNHEFETNSLYEVNDFFSEVEKIAPNFHYLDDEALVIADAFRLVGRRDYSYGGKSRTRESIEEILKRKNLYDSNLDLIVLDHQPQDYKDSLKENAILQLSGHTHDGQIFPGNILIGLYHKMRYGCISYGLYQEGSFNFFVTRGYGAWGFPLRTTGASEVLVINYNYQ